MTTHRLRTWPRYYQAVVEGRKTFEVRKDDRAFAVGDVLHLVEWSIHGGETGREVKRKVIYIARRNNVTPIPHEYVILATVPVNA